MRWIGATVCVLVVLGLGSLYLSRNVLRTDFGGQHEPFEFPGEFAFLRAPATDAMGEERVEQWRELAYDTCAVQRVDRLARQLKTKATPEEVASGYARYARDLGNNSRGADAAREGCLEGFGG